MSTACGGGGPQGWGAADSMFPMSSARGLRLHPYNKMGAPLKRSCEKIVPLLDDL